MVYTTRITVTPFQVALKWFYLQQIVERGYHPIFLDNDVVVLQVRRC